MTQIHPARPFAEKPALQQALERAASAAGQSAERYMEAVLRAHLGERGFLEPGRDEGLRPDELNASNDG